MHKYVPVRESDIEDYLVREIKKIGGRAIKFNPHNNRGLPDRICFIPGGLVLLVEVKRPGQTPRSNQIVQLERFKRLGVQATWCDTQSRVDSIIRWIKDFKQKYKMVCDVTHLCYRQECPLRRNK
jgi:hypothetical protein